MRTLTMVTGAAALGLLVLACDQAPTAVADTSPGSRIHAAASAAATTTNQVVSIEPTTAFVSCAADGAGELVDLEGSLHVLTHVTTDAEGHSIFRFHLQPMGVKGTGETTGDVYEGTGVTQSTETFDADQLPDAFTFVNNFRIIGPGAANDLLVHELTHITIDANGDATADVSTTRVECR